MKRSLLAVFGSLALAACGGGGSGGIASPNPQPATLKITPGNAVATTQSAYQAAAQSVGFGDMLGGSGLIVTAPGGVSKGAMGQFAKAVSGGSVMYVPIGPDTRMCAVDGSVTISGNLADPTTLSPGDEISIRSEDCDDGLGEIIDGLLEFTVETFDGDVLTGLYRLEMTLALTDFQVRTAEDVITSNGTVTVDLDTRQNPFVAASVRGNSMTTDTNTSSETLRGFIASQTLDAGASPSPFTWTASGQIDSTQLGGSVDYSTPLTFEGFDADYPHTGELFIEGDGSSALLRAENNVSVTIEIDHNGDGVVDETISTTWAELTTS